MFVAVELCDSVRRAAEDAVVHLQRGLAGTLRARWVPAGHMHLTVRFIGHVADDRVSGVLDALGHPIPIQPFDVALAGCGVFPAHGPPRTLWIGLSDGLPSLTAVHNEMNRRLRPIGLEPEARPYTAHLTLARVKDAPRGSSVLIKEALRTIDVAPAACRITRATVFESRVSRDGARYSAVLQIPFDGT